MILQWLTSPEWENFVRALLHTLWQGAIIAVLLAFALRRVNSPTVRYRCSLAALGGMLFAGLVTWAVLSRPLPQPSSASTSPPETISVHAPTPAGDLPPLVGNFSRPEPKPAMQPWSGWLALVWLLGAASMLVRGGFQVAGAERLRRSARPLEDARIAALLEDARRAVGLARRVRMVVTDKLTSPAVVGVLMPTLILPLSLATTLTPEQIRFVLLHELAHIRRGDYFASLFQLVAEALLFFNPAVWWISRQMRLEREACCDALAIELSGAPADYALTLVRVAENVLSPAPAAALAFGDKRGPSSLADRVQRLLVPGYRPALRLTWRAMLVALFVGGGLLFLSALGTRFTVAAILTPQERIARIEKKMTELGEKPVVENNSSNPEDRVLVLAHLKTADGSPLPQKKQAIIHSQSRRTGGIYGANVTRSGTISNTVAPGQIWVEANVDGFAPAVIGPFDGSATKRIDAGDLILDHGFEISLHVSDADSGEPVANAALHTQFWLREVGNGIQQSRDIKTDAAGRVPLPLCINLPLTVTVNAPGYEILDQRFETLKAGQTLDLKLKRGAVVSGVITDKSTGDPVPGATVRMIFEKGRTTQRYQWDDKLRVLATTDAGGRFVAAQLRSGTLYWLGVSAPGHESLVLEKVTPGTTDLAVKIGPELVVHGHVIGSLDSLQQVDHHPALYRSYSEMVGDGSWSNGEWVRLQVTDGVATFQFTNHARGPVTLTSETGYREEREVTEPVADWVVNLNEAPKTDAEYAPKCEVIFRFKDRSGAQPRGTVEVMIPDSLDKKHLTAHTQEMQITNGEVHVQIAIGGRTSIDPKRMVGYWFNRAGERGNLLSIEVTNGPGPMVIEIPLVPAGAIYARAKNADGTPAGGLFFGVSELKKAPGRDDSVALDSSGDNISDNAPRKWVSGPLPLGGTYQIHAWRENSFSVSKPVKLTEANPDAEVELQFPPGKKFDGVVLDAAGQPLRDAEVKVSFSLPDNHGFGLKSVFTDERGRFRLEDTTPDMGRYSVEIDAPGMMAASVELIFRSQPQTIRLQRGRTLAGRVVEANSGYPIPGMEIRALDYEQNKLPMLTTHTDADGHFEFTTLGDVNYTLYPDGGELLPRLNSGNQKFRADGRTNLTLTVKLYEWSKLKPKAPPTTVGTTNAAHILADPKSRE